MKDRTNALQNVTSSSGTQQANWLDCSGGCYRKQLSSALCSVSLAITSTLIWFRCVLFSATWSLLWFFSNITDALWLWTSGWEGKSCPAPFLKIPNVCYLFCLIPPCGLPSISKDLRAKMNLSKHLAQLSYTWWNRGPERSDVGQQSQHWKKEKKKTQAVQLAGSASFMATVNRLALDHFSSEASFRRPQQQLERSLWSWTDLFEF